MHRHKRYIFYFNAVQSVYGNLSCTIKVNNFETGWFCVKQGVKQGCVISPKLFSIYVNDLAKEIDDLHCGVSLQATLHISVFFYADDIAILSETEDGMQKMLDKLNDWCCKWHIIVNETKTKRSCISDQKLRVQGIIFLIVAIRKLMWIVVVSILASG